MWKIKKHVWEMYKNYSYIIVLIDTIHNKTPESKPRSKFYVFRYCLLPASSYLTLALILLEIFRTWINPYLLLLKAKIWFKTYISIICIYQSVIKKHDIFFFTKTWKYRRTCLNKNPVQSTARNFNFKRFLIVPEVFPFK